MPIQINYKNRLIKKNSNNIVLFVDENFTIKDLKKYISVKENAYISDLIKNKDKKKIFLHMILILKKK